MPYTDEQIKTIVRREIGQLDARLRHGRISQEWHTARSEEIRKWAENASELALYN